MNVRLFGLAAAMMAAMSVVACGDDTTGAGGAGSGGGSTGTDATASTGTGSTTSTSSSSPTSSSGGEGGQGGSDTTSGTGGEGGSGEGGAPSDAPCAVECSTDAGCDDVPANPDGACSECVQGQADAQAPCAIEGAFSDECQNDPDCADYVDCVLNQGATCEADFPAGAQKAAALVLATCGDCGDGSIQ